MNISNAIVQVTPEVFIVTEILSASTVKRLAVGQGRFLKKSNNLGIKNFNETASYMLLC